MKSCLVNHCDSLAPKIAKALPMAELALIVPKITGGDMAVVTMAQIVL